MDWRDRTAPTIADIEALAHEALRTIPDELRRHVKDVVVVVEEFCDEETEKEMDLDSPFDLLGLYRGTSLRHKSVHDVRQDVDMIHLYRRPLLDYWAENPVTFYDLVRNTIIHEVGHHFGLNDDDMERLERD